MPSTGQDDGEKVLDPPSCSPHRRPSGPASSAGRLCHAIWAVPWEWVALVSAGLGLVGVLVWAALHFYENSRWNARNWCIIGITGQAFPDVRAALRSRGIPCVHDNRTISSFLTMVPPSRADEAFRVLGGAASLSGKWMLLLPREFPIPFEGPSSHFCEVHSATTPKLDDEGCLTFSVTGSEPYIEWYHLRIRAARYKEVVVTLRTDAGSAGRLLWEARARPVYLPLELQDGERITASGSIDFEGEADGLFHEIRLPVGRHREWVGTITGLRICLDTQETRGTVTIRSIRGETRPRSFVPAVAILLVGIALVLLAVGRLRNRASRSKGARQGSNGPGTLTATLTRRK